METAHEDEEDAGIWAGRVADVSARWFAHASWLHGVRHTQRVHIHAQRLIRELRWPEADARVVLSAAVWHDIGRVSDGWDPRHGALSAARVVELGLDAALPGADARLARFAIRYHCRSDERGALRATGQNDPERALSILWLLKDADALDRVRLGNGAYEIDSTALRHDCTIEMVDFAEELLNALP
jgi:HD superfamily phosphodiesterase